MIQMTLFDDFIIKPGCKKCGAIAPLFEEWYADDFEEGMYCEPCIDGEYDE